jgi:5-methylcytosine-specific restriction enzyme subunit McrC
MSEGTNTAVRTLRLTEYQDRVCDLKQADAEYVLSQLAPKISIRRRVQDGLFILNPNQFVGVVTLPSGRRLEIYPKVPVRNLFYMLAVAWRLPPPFKEQLAQFARLDDILEFIVSFFADLVGQRLKEGLYRSYVEREDNLAAVRGRIRFAEDVRRNFVLRHRTYCRYDEFTWDIPENQIIRQVIHLLSGWGFERELQRRLYGLDASLSEITPVVLSPRVIDRFQYNRLNEDYRQIHRFCALFLDGASLSEESGPFDFQTFLVDMSRLFEEFVTQTLRERAPDQILVDAQVPLYLGHGHKVLMRPDIVVGRESSVVLVADCKYKRLGPSEFNNHDMYQMLAYCTATRVRQGVLIYPLHAVFVQDEVEIRNTHTVVRQVTIDLGKEELGELGKECDALVDGIFGYAQADIGPQILDGGRYVP